ncbi:MULTISPECIES: DUF1697 domain-containing protein [unclassified Paenibacillus]|uniref:DUF1697 domain-containing protein n=1 Tax=unclassified Paenibacillus TaxID=185978 RepID=UPI00240685E1|nr:MULTISPECIES: DUF1697 domain-containing protein [unclassified Paenibacillus]MDF9839028.1 uncharacterized protein (DUF1697 family) [Paenibacillus sp. PastF-2]MDF9845610.1 uncharacterized protein (DUF1697 family) [Paenibacillus sp. PastM-2]MDF9852181.1 uncharacterized protein (DUF1697 family) [Paenibacillus sp. PastF-1]MDH6478089.1 uncharacterized protein (DUF1697 family) [Paenibacillus sp. PastH-2]MDH6505823.1 uncharacterized protein (DUF1697 family) [Paenibacillus sp. PastM-3]
MIYVALLRGINVGGNNIINMKLLKQTFEQAGMTSVTTYINSGNIIFAADHPREDLPKLLEMTIQKDFSLNIKVLIRSLDEIRTVMEALPDSWSNDDKLRSDVMFLWDEADDESVLDKLPLKPGIGTLLYVPGAVLYSVERENVIKSAMAKLIGSTVYKLMTVRNVNTTRKIYQLMLAAEAQQA